jgi:hypothetical protein
MEEMLNHRADSFPPYSGFQVEQANQYRPVWSSASRRFLVVTSPDRLKAELQTGSHSHLNATNGSTFVARRAGM